MAESGPTRGMHSPSVVCHWPLPAPFRRPVVAARRAHAGPPPRLHARGPVGGPPTASGTPLEWARWLKSPTAAHSLAWLRRPAVAGLGRNSQLVLLAARHQLLRLGDVVLGDLLRLGGVLGGILLGRVQVLHRERLVLRQRVVRCRGGGLGGGGRSDLLDGLLDGVLKGLLAVVVRARQGRRGQQGHEGEGEPVPPHSGHFARSLGGCKVLWGCY
ncbi:MAG: hypothetical protein J3K34DRAFT_429740 [Monoraphidium minutum]|nr:MAG: hypothetical protein J3K34DRAFT_429740 [Monoraphidium minutum]